MTTSDGLFEVPEPGRAERIGTGSDEIDGILGGGFPSNSLNILMGAPGTGKTILAEQILFHNATSSRPAIYLTTLSEPLSKVMRYLQRFGFFESEKLGDAVRYEDAGQELAEKGVQSLVPRVKAAIRESSPAILVIDSFKAVHDLSLSVPETRRLISGFAGLLSAYEITTFLVGEYSEDQVRTYPEFAVADGIVQLQRKALGTRDERYCQVLKLRGSDYSQGLHAFRITAGGIELYPRLVTPPVPPDYEPILERVTTGTSGLDAMLDGGLWRGSSTLLTGPTGSGKTTIALQFVLEGVRRGEPGLFVNFQENPTQLARHIRRLGVDVAAARGQGLHLLYMSPVELQIDRIIVEVFRLIEELGIQRLAVDAAGDLALAATDPKRLHDYLYAFVQHLAFAKVTSIMTLETEVGRVPGASELESRVSYFTDTILSASLRADAAPSRTMQVVKSRDTAHDARPRDMIIDAQGLRIVKGVADG